MNHKQRSDEFRHAAHEPVPHIDATPDKYYPLRILRAHRESCNHRWGCGDGWTEQEALQFKALNDAGTERAKLLDKAIATLEREAYQHGEHR